MGKVEVQGDILILMKSFLFKNCFVALLFTSALCIMETIDVFYGSNSIPSYFNKSIVVIFYAALFYLNKSLLVNIEDAFLRYFLVAVISGLVFIVLGFIAFITSVNFRLTIGGNI